MDPFAKGAGIAVKPTYFFLLHFQYAPIYFI